MPLVLVKENVYNSLNCKIYTFKQANAYLKLDNFDAMTSFQVATPVGSYTAQPATESNPAVAPSGNAVASRGGKGIIIPPTTPTKVKKGVKRKADSLTPTQPVTPASQVVFDPMYAPADAKAAKVGTRRESGRQIKKVSLFLSPGNISIKYNN